MRLDQAIAFTLAFGLHKGRTLGWIAKHVPHGLSYLSRLYESERLHDEAREALRSMLASPAMQRSLRRALGVAHRQQAYLLPAGTPGCPACAGSMRLTDEIRQCNHGAVRAWAVWRRCECGIEDSQLLAGRRQHCCECDEWPLFAARMPPPLALQELP